MALLVNQLKSNMINGQKYKKTVLANMRLQSEVFETSNDLIFEGGKETENDSVEDSRHLLIDKSPNKKGL